MDIQAVVREITPLVTCVDVPSGDGVRVSTTADYVKIITPRDEDSISFGDQLSGLTLKDVKPLRGFVHAAFADGVVFFDDPTLNEALSTPGNPEEHPLPEGFLEQWERVLFTRVQEHFGGEHLTVFFRTKPHAQVMMRFEMYPVMGWYIECLAYLFLGKYHHEGQEKAA